MAVYGGSPNKSLGKMVYPEDIECVLDPIDGKGGIFIGNLQASQNIMTLKKHGIKAVLTAASGACLNHPRHEIPHYKYIPGEDHERFDLSQYFDECLPFIDKALQETNILVHCMAGVSRSVTLVLAYLIKHHGLGYDQAYSMVKSRRKIIHPNDGFIEQLRRFESQVRRQSPPKTRYESPSRRNESPTRFDSPSKRENLFSTSFLEGRLSNASPSKIYQSPSKRGYESPLKNYESPLKRYESPTKHSDVYERAGLSSTEQPNPENRLLKDYMNEARTSTVLNTQASRSFLNTTTLFSKHTSSSAAHYRGKSEVENKRHVGDEDIDKKIADIRKKYADMSENIRENMRGRITEDDTAMLSSYKMTAGLNATTTGAALRKMKSINYDQQFIQQPPTDFTGAPSGYIKTHIDNFMPETSGVRLALRRQTTMFERTNMTGVYPPQRY